MEFRALFLGFLIPMLLLSGCSQEPTGTASTEGESPLPSEPLNAAGFISLVRNTNSFDYEPTEGPNELRGQVDVVVQGRVSAVTDGRAIGPPDEAPLRHIVVALEPVEVFKGPSIGDLPLLYIELNRPDSVSADFFAELLPVGTTSLVFGYLLAPSDQQVDDDYAGRETGTDLYGPAPQGLFFDVDGEAISTLVGPDEMIAEWSGLTTIDSIVEALSQEE